MNIIYRLGTSGVACPILLVESECRINPLNNQHFGSNVLYLPTENAEDAKPILSGLLRPSQDNYISLASEINAAIISSSESNLPEKLHVCVANEDLYLLWRNFAESLSDYPFQVESLYQNNSFPLRRNFQR